jgi:ribosomal protein L37AE/L43A
MSEGPDEIQRKIDRAIALMRHTPQCPRCRSLESSLFDNTKPLWRCAECALLYLSAPATETAQ